MSDEYDGGMKSIYVIGNFGVKSQHCNYNEYYKC